ncbi:MULTISPECIES: alpha/beta hydrolase [unclassified Sphingomonas]|uniref:alpha/beta hydrolase n=1 Tax=unclassified Sphingomonas TaxID=196159 RepID=UPI000E771A74|nr:MULTISPECIES: alpha/beta hydrolase [unclassified Sphingomonas]RKE45662.1 acetyl esterase/lipase [Sphingomonas sp. PP-CC-1A-547]TCM06611.1 acetyl esterase/lipase [Sphingomonas sp. PP-CC-3G-468]
MLGADDVWPLWADEPAVTFEDPSVAAEVAVVTTIDQPVLLGFRAAKPNGRAMLVLGGGGYTQLMAGREGVQVAAWLTGLGYHAFVLIHRFPNAANGIAAPLDDAREAMRRVRASGLAPVGLGVVGLSSGGHLAACLAAAYPDEWTAPASRHPDEPTRPDVMVMGYAPISTNAAGRTIIADKPPLPPVEKQAMYDRLQPDAQLLPSPPPAFIVYAGNDPVVPVENARRLYTAWQDAGGAAELHVFADAPHGFALDTQGLPVSIWPTLCEAWLRQVGFLD